MKKIILIIVLCLTLTGCGIFNISNFVIPNNLEFITTIDNLDTPEKIGNYMMENFTYESHPCHALSPYILWQTEKGDCNDFACFGTFVANYHGYETYQIEIYYGTIYLHFIGVYMEDMYSFTDNRTYHYGFNTFRDIVNESGKYTRLVWKNYKVYDYSMGIVETGGKE